MRFDAQDALLKAGWVEEDNKTKEPSLALDHFKYRNPADIVKFENEEERDDVDMALDLWKDWMHSGLGLFDGGDDIYRANDLKIAKSIDAAIDSLDPKLKKAIYMQHGLTKEQRIIVSQNDWGGSSNNARVWKVNKGSFMFQKFYEEAKDHLRPLLKKRGVI